MSTTADIRRRIAEQRELADGDEAAGFGDRTCGCGNAVDAETFNRLGARCSACYASWCRRIPSSPDVGNAKAHPRSWAYALRRRELDGAALSPVQRDAWREALGLPPHCRADEAVPTFTDDTTEER